MCVQLCDCNIPPSPLYCITGRVLRLSDGSLPLFSVDPHRFLSAFLSEAEKHDNAAYMYVIYTCTGSSAGTSTSTKKHMQVARSLFHIC